MNNKKSKTTRNIIIVIIAALLIGWGLLGEDDKTPMTQEEYKDASTFDLHYACEQILKEKLDDEDSYESTDSFRYKNNGAVCDFDKKECSIVIGYSAKNLYGGRVKGGFFCKFKTDDRKNPTQLLGWSVI